MKKILVTGSTGMLGAQMIRTLANDKRYEVFGLGRSTTPLLPESSQITIDLSLPFNWKEIPLSPDIIIHTAAITNLAWCETNPSIAQRVHVESVSSLAKLMRKDSLFIYISTDSVFDGLKGDYTELDIPNPLNVYARTKFEGEHAVLHQNQGQTLILRTNIYGVHLPLKSSLAEWAITEWLAGKTISGFSDIMFNAIYTGQLTRIIKYLVTHDTGHKILNVANDSYISKYTFLKTLLDEFKLPKHLLIPKLSADAQSSIRRPSNTTLNTSLLATFHPVPTMEVGLEELLNFMREKGILKNEWLNRPNYENH